MPSRLVREGIKDSEAIDGLSDWAFRFYIHLLVTADDAGRIDGRLSALRSRLFPLGTSRRDGEYAKALGDVVARDLAYEYVVDGKPYVQITKVQKGTPALYSKCPDWQGRFEIQWVTKETADGAKSFVLSSIREGRPNGNPDASLTEGLGNPSASHTKPFDPTPSKNTGTGTGTGRGSQKASMHPPSLEDARAYWQEAGLNGNPEAFVDHHASKGWVIGKAPMRDWKAAARNWSRNEHEWKSKAKGATKATPIDPSENERRRQAALAGSMGVVRALGEEGP